MMIRQQSCLNSEGKEGVEDEGDAKHNLRGSGVPVLRISGREKRKKNLVWKGPECIRRQAVFYQVCPPRRRECPLFAEEGGQVSHQPQINYESVWRLSGDTKDGDARRGSILRPLGVD